MLTDNVYAVAGRVWISSHQNLNIRINNKSGAAFQFQLATVFSPYNTVPAFFHSANVEQVQVFRTIRLVMMAGVVIYQEIFFSCIFPSQWWTELFLTFGHLVKFLCSYNEPFTSVSTYFSVLGYLDQICHRAAYCSQNKHPLIFSITVSQFFHTKWNSITMLSLLLLQLHPCFCNYSNQLLKVARQI